MSQSEIKENKVDENLKEIMKKAAKSKTLSKEEVQALQSEFKYSTDFVELLDQIDVDGQYDRVIYTDGNEQLIYINGEFYICDTKDSTKEKKKKKKEEAKDLYLEYFIRYQLNPLIEKKSPEKEKVKVKNVKTVDSKHIEGTKNIEKTQLEKPAKKIQKKKKLSKEEFNELTPEEKVLFIAGATKEKKKEQKHKEDEIIR